jgi:hypothetical protein
VRQGRVHWGAAVREAGPAVFPRPDAPEAEQLYRRLAALGLRPVADVRLTSNRSVMVSFSKDRALRVHRGFAQASDRVLKAIVRFVAPGTPRALRKAAEHEILSYHAERLAEGRTAPKRRVERARPGDAPVLARLADLFTAYNARHFGGALSPLPIRLSSRMRTRLGHLALDGAGVPTEITISRRHLKAHGWEETAHTLLHEMVHQWQHANGHAVDHGPAFRAKAREVGVTAGAQRWVRRGGTARADG